MTEPKPIELRLLGEMRVHGPENGAESALAGQTKRLALLAYLALEPGYHRRESVMDLFWPESDPEAARQALRQSLYHLCKTLGRTIYERRGDEIRIDPAALWCDAPALERACDEGDEDGVVRLFRGELLPGFHVDDVSPDLQRILDDARRRIGRKGLRALRDLAARESRAGRHDAAIRVARQALEAAPHDEPSLRILVAALVAAGDRVEAVRTGTAFLRRLESEMGLEPAAETLAAIRAAEERPAATSGPADDVRPLPSTLSHPLTSLVGRPDTIRLAVERLARPDVRILSLTGPGGVGKSRLAIEIAERSAPRYPHGIAWVNLDAYADAEAALVAVARAVDAEMGEERCVRAALRERLAGLDALLVLDGLDRVPETGMAIADVLGAAPGVDAVLTSRTPIGHSAEHRLPVPPLSLPERGRHVGVDLPLDSEAVALFVDRARAADPEFRLTTTNVGAVIEICLRLDGLPLAIELAAGRVCHLPVEEIARRLERDPGLLRGDARDRPERHETLDAAIRWTSEHLSDDERSLLQGLGAFAGDFDLSTVEAVWDALDPTGPSALDLLSALIDRGLVQSARDSAGRPRYRLLRTIRDHAAAALRESGREAAWLRRLADHYAEWAQEGFRHYCGPDEATWLATLDREAPNLEAVVDWAVEAEPERAARIVAPLVHWWTSRGLVARTRRRIEAVLERIGEDVEAPVRGRLFIALGMLAQLQGDQDRAVEHTQRGLEVYREAGDPTGHGYALQSYARVLMNVGRFDDALAAAEEGLAIGERTGNALRVDNCGTVIATIATIREDFDRAERVYARTLSRARASGNRAGEVLPLIDLAELELARGRPEIAEGNAIEALRIAEALGSTNRRAYASATLADVRRALGRTEEVQALYASALDLYRTMGNEQGMSRVLTAFGEMMLEAGDLPGTLRLVAGLANHLEERSVRYPPVVERVGALVDRTRERVGDDAFERERAATRGVGLERLAEWAEERIPTVEIQFAAR